MLLMQTPETFETALTITGVGQKIKLDVTFNNIEPEDIDADAKAAGRPFTDTEMLLKLVKSWSAEDVPLTTEGVDALEKKRPGFRYAIIQGFFRGRLAALEKN